MTFNFVSGNPDHLVGGDTAQMSDIQGPFYDIRDYLNSTWAIDKVQLTQFLFDDPPRDQEWIYGPTMFTTPQTAYVQPTPYWHMRAVGGGASAQWIYLGGTPAVFGMDSARGFFDLGGAFLSTMMRIRVPHAGRYKVTTTVRVAADLPLESDPVAWFSLVSGISKDSGEAVAWTEVGTAPVCQGAPGSITGVAYFNVPSIAENRNFESWIISPGFGTIGGTINYGSIAIEPVTLVVT